MNSHLQDEVDRLLASCDEHERKIRSLKVGPRYLHAMIVLTDPPVHNRAPSVHRVPDHDAQDE